jgi:hypothetical protein
LYFCFTLFSILILCDILDLRRLAPTNVVVDTREDDECPCPFVLITVRGFSSPSSVSSSSSLIKIC